MKEILINLDIRKDVKYVDIPSGYIPVLIYLSEKPTVIGNGVITINNNIVNVKAQLLDEIPFDDNIVTLNIAGAFNTNTKTFHISNLLYCLKLQKN